MATLEYLFIDSCQQLQYKNQNFCQNIILTIFGFYPKSDPGIGNAILLAWSGFFMILGWLIPYLRRPSPQGIHMHHRREYDQLCADNDSHAEIEFNDRITSPSSPPCSSTSSYNRMTLQG